MLLATMVNRVDARGLRFIASHVRSASVRPLSLLS